MNKLIILLLTVCMAGQVRGSGSSTLMYGKATYYADRFNHHRTSSGEIFNMDSFTAASKSLPFGTLLRVTNTTNNKSVIVRVNDRCPRNNYNLLDLSKAAAKSIDMIKSGSTYVKVENIGITPEFKAYYEALAVKMKARNAAIAQYQARIAKNNALVLAAKKKAKNAYTVQIGTFQVKSNVDKLTASLNGKGFKNNYVKLQSKNTKTLYNVSVGPYYSAEEANKALLKLKAFKFDGQIIKGASLATL